jgi:2-iminobutanoate/2-iminopropanoate deaminase
MKLRKIVSPDAPVAATYAQAVELSDFKRVLFISGQTPVRQDGTVPNTFLEQIRCAWTSVKAQLQAVEMAWDNLVKATTCLSDRDHIDEYRQARDETLGGRKVGLTTVVTGIFDEAWLLEIEAIAAA